MKLGRYLGSAWTKYVALPILGLGIGFAVSAQRYDIDIKHYPLPDMDGDGVPEVLTTVSHLPGGGSAVCLLKSGKDGYSDMLLEGNIVKTKILEDRYGNFTGIELKTDEGNGTRYFGNSAGLRKASRRQIRQALSD